MCSWSRQCLAAGWSSGSTQTNNHLNKLAFFPSRELYYQKNDNRGYCLRSYCDSLPPQAHKSEHSCFTLLLLPPSPSPISKSLFVATRLRSIFNQSSINLLHTFDLELAKAAQSSVNMSNDIEDQTLPSTLPTPTWRPDPPQEMMSDSDIGIITAILLFTLFSIVAIFLIRYADYRNKAARIAATLRQAEEGRSGGELSLREQRELQSERIMIKKWLSSICAQRARGSKPLLAQMIIR